MSSARPAAASSSAPRRVEWLDMLRGLAMACVILAHPIDVPSDVETLIYSFHMPLFFMISGATFRFEKYATLGACVKDQAIKLLVPYVTLYLVCVPAWYLNHRVLGSSTTPLDEFILGFFAANQDVAAMPNGALWFLPALFLATVVYWGLCRLDRTGRVSLAGSLGTCFALGVALCTFTDAPVAWHVDCIPMIVFFYALGQQLFSLYRKKRDVLESASPNVLVPAIAVLLSLGVWASTANGKISVHGNDYHIVFLALVSSVCISVALALILMRLPRIWVLSYAGRASLAFFGLHVPVMRFFENLPATEGLFSAHPLWVAVVTFVVLIPLTYLVERFLPFVIGRPFGSFVRAPRS